MRTCSEALGAVASRSSEWTSQSPCARKARSKDPARNWGRPKRSRVKNRVIRQDEVFYHDQGTLRETSVMNDERSILTRPMASDAGAQNPAPDFAAAVQPSYVRTVFLGPDGLRAGWGFAFYAAMFYPLQFVAVRWAGSLNEGPLRSMALAELGVLLAAVIPSVVLARVEQRKWGVYGLPGRMAFGKLFWV